MRHRRTSQVFGAAVAVVAVILSGIALQANINGRQTADPSPSLVVPPRTQSVGFKGVAVTISDDWRVYTGVERECGTTQNTVMFVRREPFDLPAGLCGPAERNSSLHLVSVADEDMAPIVEDARAAGSVDGVELFKTSLSPQGCNTKRCEQHQFHQALIVPSKGMLMYVDSPRKSIIRDVLPSVRIIPQGYSAVPDVSGLTDDSDTTSVIEEAGLIWNNRCSEDAVCDMDPVAATDPRVGSVVPLGTTVRAAGSDLLPRESRLSGQPPTQMQLFGTCRAVEISGRPETGAPRQGDNPNVVASTTSRGSTGRATKAATGWVGG